MRLSSWFVPFAALRFAAELQSTSLRKLCALLPARVVWRTWCTRNMSFLWWQSPAAPSICLMKAKRLKVSEDSCSVFCECFLLDDYVELKKIQLFHSWHFAELFLQWYFPETGSCLIRNFLCQHATFLCFLSRINHSSMHGGNLLFCLLLISCLVHSLSSSCCHPSAFCLCWWRCDARFHYRRQCTIIPNTWDCHRMRCISHFVDYKLLLYAKIDAHPNWAVFLLILKKVQEFYQLRNRQHAGMVLVETICFLHPNWCPGILIFGMLVTSTYAQVVIKFSYWRCRISNTKGSTKWVIMCHLPW